MGCHRQIDQKTNDDLSEDAMDGRQVCSEKGIELDPESTQQPLNHHANQGTQSSKPQSRTRQAGRQTVKRNG